MYYIYIINSTSASQVEELIFIALELGELVHTVVELHIVEVEVHTVEVEVVVLHIVVVEVVGQTGEHTAVDIHCLLYLLLQI